jgi:TPR repeat protein
MALKSRGGLSPSDAMAFFSAASQAGRVEARRAIGEMYLKGIGIAPDAQKGQSWLTQAADAGDGGGARAMGDSLFESDPKAALIWYEKAAAAGDSQAAYIAAIMYAENYEIRPNSAKAAILLRQAAESGIAGAQADYGLLVYQGAGTPRSIEGAANWFKKSAEGGDAEGQFLYAFTLAKGEGVAQNFEEAYYWLLKSGQSGVDDYDLDRKKLRERLEANVAPAILARARSRAGK